MPAPALRRSWWRRAGALGLDASRGGRPPERLGKGGKGEPANSRTPLTAPRDRLAGRRPGPAHRRAGRGPPIGGGGARPSANRERAYLSGPVTGTAAPDLWRGGAGNGVPPTHLPGAAPRLAPSPSVAAKGRRRGPAPPLAPRPAGSGPHHPHPHPLSPCTRRRRGRPPPMPPPPTRRGADPAGTALKVSRSCCGVADMCSTVHGSIS